jgi:hypothetical protein
MYVVRPLRVRAARSRLLHRRWSAGGSRIYWSTWRACMGVGPDRSADQQFQHQCCAEHGAGQQHDPHAPDKAAAVRQGIRDRVVLTRQQRHQAERDHPCQGAWPATRRQTCNRGCQAVRSRGPEQSRQPRSLGPGILAHSRQRGLHAQVHAIALHADGGMEKAVKAGGPREKDTRRCHGSAGPSLCVLLEADAGGVLAACRGI